MSILGVTLTCREIVELMTDYLENRLADGDRIVFERHLVQCPPCRDYLAQLRQTIVLVGSLEPPDEKDISPQTREALIEAFRNFRRSKK